MHWHLVIYFALFGLFVAGLAIPMILRKVPPNPWYGFRLPKTRRNPDIWYTANEYAGKLMVIAGAVITLASVVLGMLRMSDIAYLALMSQVTVISLLIMGIVSLIYLKTL